MDITITVRDLVPALARVVRVVEKRRSIPILANVLIEAADGALRLTGTDLDLYATETIAAAVTANGDATLPAHAINNFVKKLPPAATLHLYGDGDAVVIISGGSIATVRMPTLPVDDFPRPETRSYEHRFTLAATDLARLLDKTQFAISTEETRYYLNGIFMHTIEVEGHAMLRAVATDGHRLARVEMLAPTGASGMPGVIIPSKTVAALRRMAGASIVLEISRSSIRATGGNSVLMSKTIDGTYPDYVRVIPTKNAKTLTAHRTDFIGMLKRLPWTLKAVTLSLANDELELSGGGGDEKITQGIEAEYNHSPLEIGFDPRYLLDILTHLDGDRVVARFDDAGSPAIFQSDASADPLYVLMPRRVRAA